MRPLYNHNGHGGVRLMLYKQWNNDQFHKSNMFTSLHLYFNVYLTDYIPTFNWQARHAAAEQREERKRLNIAAKAAKTNVMRRLVINGF